MKMKSPNFLGSLAAAGFGALASYFLLRKRRKDRRPVRKTNGSERLAARQFSSERQQKERRRLRHAMGWSAANLAVAVSTRDGSHQPSTRFHELNGATNAVGGLMAATRYLVVGRLQKSPNDDVYKVIQSAHRREQLLMAKQTFNLARLALGIYLRSRGKVMHSPRATGYGGALLWQGTTMALVDGMHLRRLRRHRRLFEAKMAPGQRQGYTAEPQHPW